MTETILLFIGLAIFLAIFFFLSQGEDGVSRRIFPATREGYDRYEQLLMTLLIMYLILLIGVAVYLLQLRGVV